ncbi:hypothetical protein [Streptodolium elevatio]|uniref:Uncharacterized protein n=1 Tax=Streptodolium elevatio TaxID=3157996 RepID=A0ABV3DV23_9ACTN
MRRSSGRAATLRVTPTVGCPIPPQETPATHVSGEGTDSTERGRRMWARVKGRTEIALLVIPFHGYMFRPGFILVSNGEESQTPPNRRLYPVFARLYPLIRRLAPNKVTSTESIGPAMLAVAGRAERGSTS